MVQGGPNSGTTIELAGRPMTLGRRSDNDVVVDENTVSRRHALILETPSGYVIRDLSTPNGTYVNSDRVGDTETPLSHGDRIRLAGSTTQFIFRQEGPSTVPMKIQPHHTGLMEAIGDSNGKETAAEAEASPLIGNDTNLYTLLQSRKGSVVTSEEIAKFVWPELADAGESVINQVIDQSIARIRLHLGDDPNKPGLLIPVGDSGFMLL